MADDADLTSAIRDHYDRVSFFYRTLWGDHIHHGYWEGEESVEAAQVQLVDRLARRADVRRGARVLDVGCGLGGSALWLARHRDCSVTGITLSPVQARMAEQRAQAEDLCDRVRFAVMDANRLDLPPQRFDVVWIIECSEHLTDKERFLEACARVLQPGGRLALCAWLAHEPPVSAEQARRVAAVCRGMLCPSLGSWSDYTRWLRAAGFVAVEAEDLTRRVERTWAHCAAIAERPEIRALLPVMDARTRDFVRAFDAIRRAYAEGAMAYGMFTATKT